MMALINHKWTLLPRLLCVRRLRAARNRDCGSTKFLHVNFVGTQQPDKINLASLGRIQHGVGRQTARLRQEIKLQPADARGRELQNVKPVPSFANQIKFFG